MEILEEIEKVIEARVNKNNLVKRQLYDQASHWKDVEVKSLENICKMCDLDVPENFKQDGFVATMWGLNVDPDHQPDLTLSQKYSKAIQKHFNMEGTSSDDFFRLLRDKNIELLLNENKIK